MMVSQSELIRVIQQLSFCREMGAVMTVLCENAREITGADGVTVVLREGDLCYYAEEDSIAPLWKGRRFPMKACISGWCMLNRKQVIIPDIYADPRIPHDAYRPTFVRSLAMVPIRSEDPIGGIGAYWADQHQTSLEELDVLQALGDSASMALANAQLIESLREADRRKDEFMTMLAHELRNPLTPICNGLDVLGQPSVERETVERVREMMERQVSHMTRIMDDLLDASRLTRGKVILQCERLDLARFVRHSAEDRRALFEASGLTLELQLPQSPVWVMADATRLVQVLGNVLDNAVKFTPAGGIVAVHLSTSQSEQQAVIKVRDTGIGVEPAMLAHVFDAFAQADRSLDRSHGGLGLGLSVARALLELHAGTVEAKSEGIGRGAEFIIRLPCEPELPALTPEPVPARTREKGLRILVIEDNRDAAESLRILLELYGYKVTVAYTGREGVESARVMRPDIVLCDIGLPEMDGLAVARALRGNQGTALTRLIAVTGYGAEEDRKEILAAGFDAHLVKPVVPSQLLGHLVLPSDTGQSLQQATGA